MSVSTVIAQPAASESRRTGWRRVAVWAVIVALLVSVVGVVFAPSAAAEDEDEDVKNYSLYQLSSNAAAYFNEQNSPEKDGDGPGENWDHVLTSPAAGGDFLGYFDENFSIFNITGWMASNLTGSTQTYTYDSLDVEGHDYSGMIDYGHYGATLRQLGLDSMNTGFMDTITHMITGGIMWFAYVLAMVVSVIFSWVIKVLQLLNPFAWFYSGVSEVSETWASGMVGEETGNGESSNMFVHSLQTWIGGWWWTLNHLSWVVMVPLFTAFVLVVFWRGKQDRGSKLKTYVIRLVYIGVGLPLLGSMYTSILNQFDTDVTAYGGGPTRVVLSTYVDFEDWMMDSRLAIPSGGVIEWENDGPSQDSNTSVRNTALLINKQSNDAFSGVFSMSYTGTDDDDAAVAAWTAGSSKLNAAGGASSSAEAFSATLGILSDYMTNDDLAASDYEAAIKSVLSGYSDTGDMKKWFTDTDSYGDVEKFGMEKGPKPDEHPILSVSDNESVGLTSSSPGGDTTTFTSVSVDDHCGLKVTDDGTVGGKPVACNMSVLSAYNYLNTRFNASSLEIFSSNNVMSGLSRQNHSSVSMVGTGFSRYNYYINSLVLLACIAILGIWYAVGMLAGSIKRYGGMIGAIPFAQLGSIQAITKVITYTIALVLEIVMTVFLYEFVSQFLLSLPDLLSGPLAEIIDSAFGKSVGAISGITGLIVVVLTLISSIIIVAATVALLRVRKTVLKALDEAVSKFISRLTEAEPTPGGGGKGSALGRAAAAGLGAGAAAAGGKHLANKLGGGKTADSAGQTAMRDPRSKDVKAPQGPGEIGSGSGGPKPLDGGKGGPGNQGGPGQGGGPNGGGDGSGQNSQGGQGSDGEGQVTSETETQDGGSTINDAEGGQPTGGGAPTDTENKALAGEVQREGGLSDLGVNLTGQPGGGNNGADGANGGNGSGGQGGSSGEPGQSRSGTQGEPGQVGSGSQGADGQGGDGANSRGRDGAAGQNGNSEPGQSGRSGGSGKPGRSGRSGQSGQRGDRSGNGSTPGQQPPTVGSGTGRNTGSTGGTGGTNGAAKPRTSGSGTQSPVPTSSGQRRAAQGQAPVPDQLARSTTGSNGAPTGRGPSAPNRSVANSVPAPASAPVQGQKPAAKTANSAPSVRAGQPRAQQPTQSGSNSRVPAANRTPRHTLSKLASSDTGRTATEAAIRAASEQAGRDAANKMQGR